MAFDRECLGLMSTEECTVAARGVGRGWYRFAINCRNQKAPKKPIASIADETVGAPRLTQIGPDAGFPKINDSGFT
jgi:hypothetical protein